MRACIILGVVCVHICAWFDTQTVPYSTGNILLDLATMAFHFTRESFMFITGCVLFYTYYDHRPLNVWSFWKRRLTLIAIPYLVWSAIYILYTGTYLAGFDWHLQALLGRYAKAIATGNQFFLYYILVSLQLYVVFPAMVWLMRRVRRHGLLFTVAAVMELVLLALNAYVLPHTPLTGWPGWLQTLLLYRDRWVITYEFWFFAGGIVAVHYSTLRQFLLRHTRWLYAAFALSTVLMWLVYAMERWPGGIQEADAVQVLQPVMVPYAFMMTLVLWRLGVAWAGLGVRGRTTSWGRVIAFFGRVSFGIFLVHPLFLHLVEVYLVPHHVRERWWLIEFPAAVLFVYVMSGLVAEGIGRVPWLGYIVGRKAIPRGRRMRLSEATSTPQEG